LSLQKCWVAEFDSNVGSTRFSDSHHGSDSEDDLVRPIGSTE